jgi:hypothetical protein
MMRNADGSGEETKIGTGMTSGAAAGRLFFAKLSAEPDRASRVRYFADGKQLLMVQEVKTDEQRAASLALVQNWLAGVNSCRTGWPA